MMMMVWMTSTRRHQMCQSVAEATERGVIHNASYHHRPRSRQARFQVHGVDAAGKVIIRKKLRRSELRAFFEKLPPAWFRHGGVRDHPLLVFRPASS